MLLKVPKPQAPAQAPDHPAPFSICPRAGQFEHNDSNITRTRKITWTRVAGGSYARAGEGQGRAHTQRERARERERVREIDRERKIETETETETETERQRVTERERLVRLSCVVCSLHSVMS